MSKMKAVLSSLALVAFAGCEPLATDWSSARQRVPLRSKREPQPAAPTPSRLKVMTWNIKFGGGRTDFWFDKWGDRVEMTRAEVEANLSGVYRLINEVNPDLLLVQEIEINSRRSAHVDMVAGILENTHLSYAAYIPTWRSRYVPSEGLGRVDLGNALFSTYPIVSAERIALVDRADQDAVHSYFYLHRAVGRAVIDAGGKELAAMVVHTEAYDTDGTKSKQLVQIKELLDAEELPFVIGGDFNAIPPGSVKTTGFNDENPKSIGTEFEQPPYRLEDMAPFYADYVSAITLERYGTGEAQQRRYYTHSVIGPNTEGANGEPGFWNRTLDYLFLDSPSRWVDGSTDVLQTQGASGIGSEPLFLSDHCPVVGTWELPR